MSGVPEPSARLDWEAQSRGPKPTFYTETGENRPPPAKSPSTPAPYLHHHAAPSTRLLGKQSLRAREQTIKASEDTGHLAFKEPSTDVSPAPWVWLPQPPGHHQQGRGSGGHERHRLSAPCLMVRIFPFSLRPGCLNVWIGNMEVWSTGHCSGPDRRG